MGIKQIPTKKFIKLLGHLGLEYIRSKGDHDIYDRKDNPLPRPITLITSEKDVPLTHIHTSLKNLGISKKEYEELMRNL